MAALSVICIGTGFTTSGAATDSLSLTTAPVSSALTTASAKAREVTSGRLQSGAAKSQVALRARVDSCKSARKGLRWYRGRHGDWLKLRGVHPMPVGGRAPRNCSDARYLARVWKGRSFTARRAYERWHEELQRKLLDVRFVICYVFGGYCGEALRVVECESGGSRHAHNGQYLGLFQMGSSERRLYGHGDTFLAQARAAYRYFAASGYDWSPWACRP